MDPEALKSPRRSFFTRLRWCPRSHHLKLTFFLSCATFSIRWKSHCVMLLVYCLLLLVYFQFVLDREGAIQRFCRDNARAIYETGSRLLLFSNDIIAICAGTGDKEANGGESSVNPGGEEQPDGSVGVCLQVSFTAGHPGDCKTPPETRFTLGSVAGAAGATAVYPIDLVWDVDTCLHFNQHTKGFRQ